MRIITFGTYDLLHEGHINILRRCKNYENRVSGQIDNYLIVGISSDELSDKKGKKTHEKLEIRVNKIKQLNIVDEIFIEEKLEDKRLYIEKYNIDILIMGDDWKYKFDWIGIPCVYLERTKGISSTKIKVKELLRLRTISNNKYRYGVIDCGGLKHSSFFNKLKKIFDDNDIECLCIDTLDEDKVAVDKNLDGIICFNIPFSKQNLCKKGPIPVYLIDHGCSPLKFFLKDPLRYEYIDYMLLAGPGIKKCIDSYIGKNNTTKSTAFLKSSQVLEPININSNIKDIILYAPTWGCYEERLRQIETLAGIAKFGEQYNIYISIHPDFYHTTQNHKIKTFCNENGLHYNENMETGELIKYSKVVISDVSSILIEASYIGIKTIQLYQNNYPDNPAINDLPYVFGLPKLWCGGIMCYKLEELKSIIDELEVYPKKIYNTISKNICSDANITLDADDILLYNILINTGRQRDHNLYSDVETSNRRHNYNLCQDYPGKVIYNIDEDSFDITKMDNLFMVEYDFFQEHYDIIEEFNISERCCIKIKTFNEYLLYQSIVLSSEGEFATLNTGAYYNQRSVLRSPIIKKYNFVFYFNEINTELLNILDYHLQHGVININGIIIPDNKSLYLSAILSYQYRVYVNEYDENLEPYIGKVIQ